MPDVTQPARTYLLCSGLFLLVTGLVGFALDTSFPTTSAEVAASHGHIFGVLETNGWHNLAAVGIGLPSVLVSVRWPRACALISVTSGVMNAGVFIAFATWGPESFLFASNLADQVLHALLTLGGLGCGLLTLALTRPGRGSPAPRDGRSPAW